MTVDSNVEIHRRELSHKAKGKTLSTTAIVVIIIVVVVVIAGLLSTVLFLSDGHLFGEVVGSGNLVTKEEQFSDFTGVDAGSGFIVEIKLFSRNLR